MKKMSKAKAREYVYACQRKMLKVAMETRDISTADYTKAMSLVHDLQKFANNKLR